MWVRVEERKEIKNRGRGREKRKEHLFPQLLFVWKLHDCFLIGIKVSNVAKHAVFYTVMN